jgi:branched-subunit amino acid ABC-type transport system permease component
MTTMTDRIDHFVRWFFNSSPEQTAIEPTRSMGFTEPAIRRSAIVFAAVAAFVLLLLFHSVVAGAVERAAAHRRADAELVGLQAASPRAPVPIHFAPRKLARAGD